MRTPAQSTEPGGYDQCAPERPERRRHVRVPVQAYRGLAAVARTTDGRRHEVQVNDIGPLGLQIEFADADAPDLRVDDGLQVDLWLGSMAASVPTLVRYRRGQRYGLALSAGLDEHAFQQIVHMLQQWWLRATADSGTGRPARRD